MLNAKPGAKLRSSIEHDRGLVGSQSNEPNRFPFIIVQRAGCRSTARVGLPFDGVKCFSRIIGERSERTEK